MRKWGAALLAVLAFLLIGTSCASEPFYQDGEYTAEFADYDARGYKDFIHVTVKDRAVVEIDFDAKNADGALKSEDENYAEDMEKVQSTYPQKYAADLSNQYLDTQEAAKVDAVAGATYSSDCFKALFAALEKNMLKGDTDTLVVDNVPFL